MVVLPLMGVVWLDLLANRDWELCFNGELRTPSVIQDYGAYLWSVFVTYPGGFLFFSAGFLCSTALWAWTRHWVSVAIWLLIVLASGWFYADPQSWHDCDRKGTYIAFGVALAQGAGVLLTLLALPFLIWWRRRRHQERTQS